MLIYCYNLHQAYNDNDTLGKKSMDSQLQGVPEKNA